MSADASSAREAFEAWVASPPYEQIVTRLSDDEEKTAWPGQYRLYGVQLAWEAWQAGAAAGSADAGLLRDRIEALIAEWELEPQNAAINNDTYDHYMTGKDAARLGCCKALRAILAAAPPSREPEFERGYRQARADAAALCREYAEDHSDDTRLMMRLIADGIDALTAAGPEETAARDAEAGREE
jgi:hypothetical protein